MFDILMYRIYGFLFHIVTQLVFVYSMLCDVLLVKFVEYIHSDDVLGYLVVLDFSISRSLLAY